MEAAQIALNTRAYAIDRFFTYLIPEGLSVAPGMRVTVPFGSGNRVMEGFVVSCEEVASPEGLKQIISAVDTEPLCRQEEISLAFWIRHRYFCSYFEALRLMLPPGSGLKYKETVILKVQDRKQLEKASSRSTAQWAIVQFLLENEGASTMTELSHELGINPRPGVQALIKKDLVSLRRKRVLPVREKQDVYAYLEADSEVVSAYISEFGKRAPAGVRLLDLLEAEGELSVSELLDGADAGRNSLQRLVEKGLVGLDARTVDRSRPEEETELLPPPELTEEQKKVLEQIGSAGEYLLCGVTGSGKTEVYLELIRRVLGEGKQAIMLVPEISLTPQTIRRFRERFGDLVAVLHSGLSLGERFDSWEKIRRGEARVVVGARSAVFAPVASLGAIIIDEQNEDTYVSEQAPRYDAREVAARRAAQAGAVLLQASATPRVQDVYRLRGRVLYMGSRYNQRQLPKVLIEDMRRELQEGNTSIFSAELSRELRQNLERGEQTILFVNRRGHSTFVSCRSCGYTFECPNCSIALKYHSYSQRLICHYCGYMQPVTHQCPSCGSSYVKLFGLGTQRAEEELHRCFPTARVLRMDQDTTAKKSAHQRMLQSFARGEADILLGTQMVTKGLDFPNVTLVGVLAADLMLYAERYDAFEEAFSKLAQVFGRAGRGEKQGRAIVQTYQPEHSCLQLAAGQDYPNFYRSEIRMRRQLGYPPFLSLITLVVTGLSLEEVKRQAVRLYRDLTEGGMPPGVEQVLNPVPCSVAKVNRYYRWQVVMKCSIDVTDLLWRIYDSHQRRQQKTNTYLSIYR